MRTPSTLIQALCFFSILFVGLVLTKRPPCEAGRWRYSEGKGRCVRCRCPKGTQLSGSEDIPHDKVLGALQCPNCTHCNPGEFSNGRTGFLCVECSTPCEERRRLTKVACDGTNNVDCGQCKEGYFERLPGDVSCMPCTNELDRAECVGKIITQSSTAPPININRKTTLVESHGKEDHENGSVNSTSHSNGSQLIVVILCILTLVLVIAIALVLIKCIPKCCNISDWIAQNLGSDSTVNSNGSSGSLLKNNLANDLEMDAVTLAGREPVYPELDPEITQRMKTTVVNRDGSLLRTIATKIDQDPEPAFLLLDISRGAIFQEKESLKGRYVSEYYLAILQKWVERNYQQATQFVLYMAFWNAQMFTVCDIILCDTQSNC